MTGGLLQLVAKGIEDVYLTSDPHITFFKNIYKKHVLFSIESIRQNFNDKGNFGKKISCLISKSGDLIGNVILVITLPEIKKHMINEKSNNIQFSWNKKIGYSIVKKIEIEIGGKIIDENYGEWLNIWSELTYKKKDELNKVIGNIPELYNFSDEKDEYTLYIPLQFWFCKSYSLAIPIICLQHTDVKINVEFNDFDKCHSIIPTHTMEIENDFVNFDKYDYMIQNIKKDDARYGIFYDYDIITKKLYYNLISEKDFESQKINTYSKMNNDEYPFNIINNPKDKYNIFSKNNKSWVQPKITICEENKDILNCSNRINKKSNIINIKESYLIIDYIYIDQEHRNQFLNNSHEYLIEQIQFTGEKIIESNHLNINLNFINPVKSIFWTIQKNSMYESNDLFNYTNEPLYDSENNPKGISLIKEQSINLSEKKRISEREYQYFNYVQAYQHFNNIQEGINMYSFSFR